MRRHYLISTSRSQKECKGPWKLFTFSKEQLASWILKRKTNILAEWKMHNTSVLSPYLHTLLDSKHSKWHILSTFWSSRYTLPAGTWDPWIELTIAPRETIILIDYQTLEVIVIKLSGFVCWYAMEQFHPGERS